ncbi:hypothetical protein [Aquimarina agarivorans]|uniref:hypothetical protein n=1 Tax=Aquimarina agarivorans TaxID=980584 RepID=UPI000495E6EA|nr:hypothetical protein [Aquimarina agarivorans]
MNKHTFHIPVMGIGFTIDTPLKVAHLGIDSVISLVDDSLIEKIRKKISNTFGINYTEINETTTDHRAKRITTYLDLLQGLTQKKFKGLQENLSKNSQALLDYCNMFPNNETSLIEEFSGLFSTDSTSSIKEWVLKNTRLGSIDVNIMTKVDKENFKDNEKLASIYKDAHAALRGFAQSNLNSSVVLSAGLNPRLYSYIQEFDNFFPDVNGLIKKRIILKVSDFRSALIQGKFLAKKGIWVSEFRIESGLNCGGHAFATDGYLMGPILAEFRDKKQELIDELDAIVKKALLQLDKTVPTKKMTLKLTAQGGVGTEKEHQFLLDHYQLDSIGWGTPFLLVPEATTVDQKTLTQLASAKEEDLYLSDISPLGIPFNNLRGNTKDAEKQLNIDKNRPGSSCPKKYVAMNKEFDEKGLCTASRQYQHLKIKELETKYLSKEAYAKQFSKIIEKSCTCVGLGTSALLAYGIETKKEGTGVSVCPGPNMAYFNQITDLKTMIAHIYGEVNLVTTKNRPHMFVKELGIYIDYLKEKTSCFIDDSKKKYFLKFANNLEEGIKYYQEISSSLSKTSLHLETELNESIAKNKQLLIVLKSNLSNI